MAKQNQLFFLPYNFKIYESFLVAIKAIQKQLDFALPLKTFKLFLNV